MENPCSGYEDCSGIGGACQTGYCCQGLCTEPSPNPLLTFTAAPLSILEGESSTLTWSAENVTSCTASGGWSGTKPLSGTEIVTPLTTTTYTLMCENTTSGKSITKSVTVTVRKPTETGHALKGTKTIDGDDTDWSDDFYMYAMEEPEPNFPVPNPTPDDVSANFKVGWDDTYLYVLVNVTDDEYDITGGTEIYHNDGIEIMIDGLDDKNYPYNSDDHQIFIRADGLTQATGHTPGDGNVIASGKQTPNGYLIEAAIRWDFINGNPPSEGVYYGFDIDVNDRDNENRESMIFWKYVIKHWTNATGYYDIILDPPVCSSLGGSCMENPCSGYEDCSGIGGACQTGYCCQGSCITSSYHRADLNKNGKIETFELLEYVMKWLKGEERGSIMDVIEVIYLWKSE